MGVGTGTDRVRNREKKTEWRRDIKTERDKEEISSKKGL